MARPLPPLPKPLRSAGAPTAAEQARRVDEWARDQHALLEALRSGNPAVLRRLDELEARPVGGGGGSVTFGTPVGLAVGDTNSAGSGTDSARSNHVHAVPLGTPLDLTPGNANADGASGDFADAEHVHGLPPFGDAAGEFCEGDDPRLEAAANGYFVKLHADVPPGSPHADDDECDSGALDGSWTLWDPQPVINAFDASRGAYELTSITNGTGSYFGGYYKAVPASEFTIVAKLSLEADSVAQYTHRMGIFVSEDLATNPTTADYRAVGIASDVFQNGFAALDFSGGSYNAVPTNNAACVRPAAYFRIRCNGTAYVSSWSPDGLSWHRLTNATLANAPTHCGFAIHSLDNIGGGSAPPARGTVHWVRFESGAGSSDALAWTSGDKRRILYG